jgi:hypothetical protein
MKTDWAGQRFCTVGELIVALQIHDRHALVFVEYDGHEQNATGEVEGYLGHDLYEEDREELRTPELTPTRYPTVRIRTGSAPLVRVK